MAICEVCKLEMLGSKSCTFNYAVGKGDVVKKRSKYNFGEEDGRCNDCGIKHGGYHHPGCDVERCPFCGGQMLGCECVVAFERRKYVRERKDEAEAGR